MYDVESLKDGRNNGGLVRTLSIHNPSGDLPETFFLATLVQYIPLGAGYLVVVTELQYLSWLMSN